MMESLTWQVSTLEISGYGQASETEQCYEAHAHSGPAVGI